MSTAYIAITSMGTDTGNWLRGLERYLYTHTSVEMSADSSYPLNERWPVMAALLVTEVPDDDDRAFWLATYQAERLATGWFGAATFHTREEAVRSLAKRGWIAAGSRLLAEGDL